MKGMTAEFVRSLLDYDKDTGTLMWRVRRGAGVKPGSIAGSRCRKGYIQVVVMGRSYKAHRIAWLLATGEWPRYQIDHINGIRDDNRWINLRQATNSQNMMNRCKPYKNRTGLKGVAQFGRRFQARVMVNGKRVSLGMFDSAEAAHAAYRKAASVIYGEFANMTSPIG